MTKNEMEYTIINNAVSTLAALCAGSEHKIIDLLTGYLWDEQEAGEIKASQPENSADKETLCKYCGQPIENYRGGDHYCEIDAAD